MPTTFEQNETRPSAWMHWPVYWSAIWVGALAALATALVLGLAGTAFGMHMLKGDQEVAHWSKFSMGVIVFSVLASFLAFVVGGWVAGKIAGILHSEPAMLQGAIVWLVAVPLILALTTHGAASYFGGWYGGLSGPAPAASMTAPMSGGFSTLNPRDLETQRAKEARNSALGAVTALLLGLVGSVVGGWMASGEPMNFSHHRTRVTNYHGHHVVASNR